jgi:hypothetical protein
LAAPAALAKAVAVSFLPGLHIFHGLPSVKNNVSQHWHHNAIEFGLTILKVGE